MPTQTPQKRELFASALRKLFLGVFVGILGFVVITGVDPGKTAAVSTNSTINFQARLETAAGAIAPDGDYNVEFKIYDSLSSGASSQGACSLNSSSDDCWWLETRTGANKVHVVNGYLTVNLGSVTPFGANIPWNQPLYLTMNIGGTGTPSWDGEMTPRLQLTAVPYAFEAGELTTLQGGNTSTLGFDTQTSANSILLPNASGTLCLDASVNNCGYLTGSGASGSYIQLQSGSPPGTAQTGFFNISGVGIAGSLQAASLDTAISSGTLAIGGTNAATINIGGVGTSTTSQTVHINDSTSSTGIRSVSIGSLNSANSQTLIQGGSTGGLSLQVGGSGTISLGTVGSNTINIGATSGSGNSSAIHIGTNGDASTVQVVSIGGYGNSGSSASDEVDIFGGSSAGIQLATDGGTLVLGNNFDNVSETLLIGNNTVGTDTITLGSMTSGTTTTIDGGSGSSAIVLQTASGGTTKIGTASGDLVTIGNASGTTTINGGTGSGAISIQAGSGATTNIDTTNNGTINIGGVGVSAVASVVHIADTAGAGPAGSTVSIGTKSGSGSTTIQGGSNGLFLQSTSVVIQTPNSNSTTALQVENAAGVSLLSVDTIGTGLNQLSNSTLEPGIIGYAAFGTGATIAQNTTKLMVYDGLSSLRVNTSTTAGVGVQITSTGIAGGTLPAGIYTLSFYLRGTVTPTVSFGGGGTCTLNTLSPTSAAYQRYFCTVTTTSATTTINITTTSTTTSFYLDDLQLVTGATVTPFNVGNIQLGGVITNPITLQNGSNSTSAFQIQNAAGTSNLFVADTFHGDIGIGTATPAFTLDVTGGINSTTGYNINGTAGLNLGTACTTGQYLQSMAVTGGIITAGSCATAGSGGITTVGTFSGSSLTNGATISGASIIFGPADATNPGMVTSSGTQIFGGNKTFTGNTLIQPATDSTSAFVVKTHGGTTVLDIDTSTGSNAGFFQLGSSTGTGPYLSTSSGFATALYLGDHSGDTLQFDQQHGMVGISTTAGAEYQDTAAITFAAPFLALGFTTANQTINIGDNLTTAAGNTATITIGTKSTGTGKDVVTIGSTNGASSTTFQAGTGGITLTGTVSASSTINAVAGFKFNGTAGLTLGSACTTGQYLQSMAVSGGIITAGTCATAAGGGGVTSVGGISSGSITNGASISGTVITFGIADGSGPGLITNGLQTIGGAKTFTSAVTATGFQGASLDTATAGTLTLGGTLATSIVFGSGSNTITYTASGGLVASGTAEHTQYIKLTPEYAGAVLDSASDSSCSSANSGTMTSGYDGTNVESYYKWASTASAQCYDVVVRVAIPADFGGWTTGTPVTIRTYSANTSTGTLAIDAKDTSNTAVTGCAYASATPGSNSTWATTGSSCSLATGTYTPGGTMTLRIRMTGATASDVRAGTITLSYQSKF